MNEPAYTLELHLADLGLVDCPCPHAWVSLGALHGVPMGKGWVRMGTEPGCRWHDPKAKSDAAA
jgi:hypothetical protein